MNDKIKNDLNINENFNREIEIKIKDKIEKSKRILITAHINPDGDAIGSSAAMYLAIRQLYPNKEVKFVIDSKIPETFNFIAMFNEIERFNEKSRIDLFDLVLSFDVSNIERLGKINQYIMDKFIINIDHHISNTHFGDINYVITNNISSTSEIVYGILKRMDVNISKEIAEAIYCGIISDTGNFSWNTNENIYLISSELKKIGMDNEKVAQNIFFNRSHARLMLLKTVLKNMLFVEKKALVYSYVTEKDWVEANAEDGDTEGIIDILKSFSSADVAVLLKEEADRTIRGSIRSKSRDISSVAEIFGGGGHAKASGFATKDNKEDVIYKIIKAL